MAEADILIKNGYVITMDRQRSILPNASITINDDKISGIFADAGSIDGCKATKVIDAGGKFIYPGFISTHTHLFQVLLKGLGRDKPLFEWLDSSVRKAIWKIDGDCCYYAALTGCIEAIRTGTTTVLDYMYSHGVRGLDDYVMKAFEDIGIRGILGRGHTKTGDFPKEYACSYNETEDEFFKEVERLEAKYRNSSRLDVALAPGIIWDLSDEGFKRTREMADKLKIPVTMHLVETGDDDKYTLEAKGMRTIPFLEKMGILGPDFIAVHCVHMTPEDIELFKKYDVKVSHNPVSNMILASGIAPVPEFLDAGITVSLAFDGAASNDTQDMLEVMKTTALQHKVFRRDASLVNAAQVLEMATLGGAKALGKEASIGSIEIGKKADIIFYNPMNSRSIPVNDPVSSLVYSSAQPNIEASIIDGKLIMENGRFINIDEEKILYKTQEAAVKLLAETGLGNTQWGQRITTGYLR